MVIKLQKKSIEDLNKKFKVEKVAMIDKKEVKEESKKVEAPKPEIKA